MPIYEYKCGKGHVFEVTRGFNDDPLTACEVCGEPVERVFHPVAVHFKGKGFYSTDYGSKKRARELKDAAESKSSKDSSSSSDSSSSDSGKSESGKSESSKPDSSESGSKPAKSAAA